MALAFISAPAMPTARMNATTTGTNTQEIPLERFWATPIGSSPGDRLSVLHSGVLLRGNGSIPFPAQLVRRIHPVRSSLRLPVQQPPFFELRDGLADLTFGELRSIPEFDLCQSWRFDNRLKDPSFVIRKEVQDRTSWLRFGNRRFIRIALSALIARSRTGLGCIGLRWLIIRRDDPMSNSHVTSREDARDQNRSKQVPDGMCTVHRRYGRSHVVAHLSQGTPPLIRLPRGEPTGEKDKSDQDGHRTVGMVSFHGPRGVLHGRRSTSYDRPLDTAVSNTAVSLLWHSGKTHDFRRGSTSR